jgi:RNA polymerase-binding protein DksA
MRLTAVRKMLENEHQRLTAELGFYSLPAVNGDRESNTYNKKLEAASQTIEFEQRIEKARRLRQQIADIERALVKITQGNYGICDDCGQPIAVARLKVVPQTNLCLQCKNLQRRTPLGAYSR